jgi:DME family drug/metabolite transporter
MPVVYVLLAALLWSTGGLGVKSVDLSPLPLAGLRSAFAVPVLALAMVVEAKRKNLPFAKFIATALRRPLIWGAAWSYAVMVVSFVVAAKLTTAANAILLQYTGPIYVALLSWPLLRERVRALDVVATLGCVAGMVLFFFDEVSRQGRIGDIVAIVSSLGFAGVPLLMRLEMTKRGGDTAVLGPLVAMVLGNGIACAVCLPSIVVMPSVGAGGWATIAFLGLFQIGVAYVLYAAAVNSMPALQSTLLASIEPVLNPLWVALVRGEKPSRFAAIGGAVILVSVTLQAALRARSGTLRDPRRRISA